MSKLSEIIKEVLLTEIGFNYKLPSDKETLMYDFYVLSYLDFVINNYNSKREDVDLQNSVEYAINVLYPALKEDLLNATFYSICAEIRHSLDKKVNYKRQIPEKSKELWTTYLKNYLYNVKSDDEKGELSLYGVRQYNLNVYSDSYEENKNVSQSYKTSYDSANKAISKTGSTKMEFINLCKYIFENFDWNSNYGGTAWANICDGYLRLAKANNKNEISISIDHVYDLQHNTDTVFNKLQTYYKNNSYRWIKDALDHKANVTSYYELLGKTSGIMKRMTFAVLKNYIGSDYESYLTNSSPQNKALKKHSTQKIRKGNVWSGEIWKGGTWENGTWKTGTWKNGIWQGGTWKDGVWKNGNWQSGTWYDGTWESGIWHDGAWENGSWYDGTWESGIWHDGAWEDGTWENGFWEKGIWIKGTWENGTWKYGFWKNGTWENGFWEKGIWIKGTWIKGIWYNGTWKDGIWKTGTWKDGIWENGTWENGTWKNGTWKNGTWEDGTWENGVWHGGIWNGGTWKTGWIYDPNKTGNYEKNWAQHVEYVKSPISPEEYFKK